MNVQVVAHVQVHLIALPDAARRLGMDAHQLARDCRTGRIPGARKLSGRWWIPEDYEGTKPN